MGAYSLRQMDYGRGVAGNDIAAVNGISGRSINKGDAADATGGSTTSANADHPVGYYTSAGAILTGIVVLGWRYLYMASKLPRNARVLFAAAVLTLTNKSWTGATIPETATIDGVAGTPFEVWAIRRRLTFSSYNFTGLTYANSFTATPWAEQGILFNVGADTDGSYLSRFVFTQDLYDTINSGTGVRADVEADIRAEVQRALDNGEDVILAVRPGFTKPGITDLVTYRVNVGTASLSSGNAQHAYMRVGYRNSKEFYGEGQDGRLDQTQLLDATSSGLAQQIYEGTPARGSVTAVKKTFVRNEIVNQQLAVVIYAGKVRVGSIRHDVAGSGRCRTVRAYNVAVGQGTISGEWEFEFTAATVYDVYVTPEGGVRTLVASGKSTASDETITYTGLNMLLLKSSANGNWAGTFASGDNVFVEISADRHTSDAPLASLDEIEIMPHAVGDRDSAYTAQARVASRGATCQLCGSDARAIANSGGVTGVIATVTDSGSFTHVKVPDPMLYQAGDLVTLAEYAAETDDGLAGRVEHLVVSAVYDIDHATYPGQVRMTTAISTPTDFNETSIFTSGVWAGALDAPTEQFLSVEASVSSDVLTLSAPLGVTTGSIGIINLTETDESAAYETKVIRYPATVSLLANQIQLTSAPGRAWPAGSLVYLLDDDTNHVPFFSRAAPALDASKGKKLGYIVADSWALAQ